MHEGPGAEPANRAGCLPVRWRIGNVCHECRDRRESRAATGTQCGVSSYWPPRDKSRWRRNSANSDTVPSYALLQALKEDADGGNPPDGKITAQRSSPTSTKVPELTKLYRGKRQDPNSWTRGQDFPIAIR